MNNSPTNLIEDLRLLEAPQPLPAIWWVVISLAVIALVWLILWRRSHANRTTVVTPAVIQAAQEDALAELQKLLAMISVQNSRAYGIAVSGVIRRYIERRFAISAPRRSTEEFLLEAKSSSRLDERHQKHLGQFLGYCDFLKFARATASVPELQQIHDAAVRFVTDTQDQPITKPAASPASVGRVPLPGASSSTAAN